jgi:hypothetical protein
VVSRRPRAVDHGATLDVNVIFGHLEFPPQW